MDYGTFILELGNVYGYPQFPMGPFIWSHTIVKGGRRSSCLTSY